MLRITTVGIVALILFCASPGAWAHGIVGQRFFPDQVVTGDAFPADGAHLHFHRHHDHVHADHATIGAIEQEWGLEVSKRLTPDLGLEVEGEHRSVIVDTPGAQSESGLMNPTITLKYAMFRSPDHEAIVSSGLTLVTGNVGKREVGAAFDPAIAPRLFFGKGFGDLPDALRYLRPIALGGDFSLAVPLTASTQGRATQTTLTSRLYLEYSLQYLQTVVKDVGLSRPFNRLVPITEFSFTTAANGPSRGRTEATVHPGLLWAGRYIEVGVAADLPLNEETHNRGGVSAILGLFLDDLAPRVFRPIIQ